MGVWFTPPRFETGLEQLQFKPTVDLVGGELGDLTLLPRNLPLTGKARKRNRSRQGYGSPCKPLKHV